MTIPLLFDTLCLSKREKVFSPNPKQKSQVKEQGYESYTKADLSSPAAQEHLASVINDTKHGGFMRVHALQTKTGHGEISDYTFCKGINYDNAVKKSLKILEKLENDPTFNVRVIRGTYQNQAGIENPTGRKSKDFPLPVTVSKTYMQGDIALSDAFASIRKSLTAPERPTKEYNKLGNGVYADDTGTMFFRDLRLVSKRIIQHGDWPFSASGEVVAIADTIKRVMPIGNYRMFRLDADYDSITMGGIEIEQESVNPVSETEGFVKKILELARVLDLDPA